MRRIKLISCFILLSILGFENFGRTQIVTIPDANFVTYLQTNFPSCISLDQLDTQCPQVLATTYMDVSYVGISDFTGIEYFTSLETFKCPGNSLTSIPSLPTSVSHLNIGDNQLTSLVGLPSNLIYLHCGGNLLTSISGLPASLDTLNCGGNQLTTLGGLPSGLIYLDCGYNTFLASITSLPSSLKVLMCSGTQIAALPTLPATLEALIVGGNWLNSLPALPPSLKEIDVNGNNLISIPTLPASLWYLGVDGNMLTSLPSLPSGLTHLHCGQNNLSILPTLPSGLIVLSCTQNNLTSLPSLPGTIWGLSCDDNPITVLPNLPNGLAELSCTNCQLTSLPELPTTLLSLQCASNFNLTCLPVLPAGLQSTNGYFGELNFPGTLITCYPNIPAGITVTPTLPICVTGDLINNPNGCTSLNGIHGIVYRDYSLNCVFETGEFIVGNVKLNLLDALNDTVGISYTMNSGAYYFSGFPDGNYNVILDTLNLPYQPSCVYPGLDSLVAVSGGTTAGDINFEIVCKPGFDIGTQSIVTESCVFPGQEHILKLFAGDIANYYSMQCAVGVSGEMNITVNGPVTYVSSAPGSLVPTTISGNTFTYIISDFSTVDIFNDFGLIFLTDTTAVADDLICVYAAANPDAGDNNPDNNTFYYCYPVVNSFDPNVKFVTPDKVLPAYESWLTYTIYFQNTGNAPAFNIKLKDTLDVLLREQTFELLGHSHPVSVSVVGNVATFLFNNIMLPDSTSDPEGSIGFAQFRVKPQSNISDGTIIENKVYIYFDFNAPIITNTATTLFTSAIAEMNEFIRKEVRPYPNPSTGVFTFTLPENFQNETAQIFIYNIAGEKVQEYSITNSGLISIDLISEKSGIYFVQLVRGDNLFTAKLVKY